MDRLHKEVEQLREQRNQQKQLADSNARQRDMYKALLTQSTGFSLPPQGDKKILRPVCSIFVGEYTHSQAFIFIYLFILFATSGQDSSPQPAQGRSSIPATRSTPQRAAAAESAPNAQTKAALKQVHTSTSLYESEC